MSLIKWNQRPLMLDSLAQDFFSSFPSFFNDLKSPNTSIPSVNIKENDKEYVMELAAPGFEKDEIKLEVKNNILFISGEHKKENETKEENYTMKEFNYSGFSRSFTLPKEVDQSNVKAEYLKGILNIKLAKLNQVLENTGKTISIS